MKKKFNLFSKYNILNVLVALNLSSCGGSSGDDNNNEPIKPSEPSVISVNISDISLNQERSIITLSNVSEITGAIYGTIEKDDTYIDSAGNYKFIYNLDVNKLANREIKYPAVEDLIVHHNDGAQEPLTFSLMQFDPYFKYQWHLYNVGDDYYSFTSSPTILKDNKIMEAWNIITNKDSQSSNNQVNALVIDTVIDFSHPDLSKQKYSLPNMDLEESVLDELNQNVTDEYIFSASNSPHGTMVAGIIAASMNDIGVRGVAYDTKLASYNLNSNSEVYKIFEENSFDVVNASYVYTTPTALVVNSEELLIQSATSFSDNSKNAVFIKAAGNLFTTPPFTGTMAIERLSAQDSSKYECIKNELDCYAGQFDPVERSKNTIVVGALDSTGNKADYSSTSSALWISAFSGGRNYTVPQITTTFFNRDCEFYKNRELSETYPLMYLWGMRGLLNTTITADNADYDIDCLYTSRMNGTSAATPVVTGVVSLLKRYTSNLTPEQIKYLIAITSSKDGLDLHNDDVEEIYQPNNKSLAKTANKWIKNSSDIYYNNMYGFGILDASSALKASKTCQDDKYCSERRNKPNKNVSNSVSCHQTGNKDDGYKYTCSIQQPDAIGIPYQIETVGLNLNVLKSANDISNVNEYCLADPYGTEFLNIYKRFAYNSITLTSPMGTEAVIKPYYSFFVPIDIMYESMYDDVKIEAIANGFYLEEVYNNSEWKVDIESMCPFDVDFLEDRLELTVYSYAN